MSSCDMCGKETILYKTIIEGGILEVCKNCCKHGEVLEEVKPKLEPKEEKRAQKPVMIQESETIEMLVPDYNKIIKKEREKRDLTQEKLAKALAEKESVIHNLERGHLNPSIQLAKKLEQFLGIRLITEYKEEGKKEAVKMDFKNPDMTIGDLIKIKQKK